MRLTIAICLVALAMGFGTWWWVELRPVSRVKQMVLSMLVDPDSAKFQDVSNERKADASCGAVNSKNRMGGYTGFIKFIAFKDGEVRFEPQRRTDVGTEDQKVEARQENINFLELSSANCFPDTKP